MTDQEKIAALMKERDEWREACLGHGEKAHALDATVSALTRKLEEAKGALEPFADAAKNAVISGSPPFQFCGASDYERALSVYRSLSPEQPEKPEAVETGEPVAWQPTAKAPEDQHVILATSGRHVGEALMLIDEDTGEQKWTWACGPVSKFHKPLGWMPMPQPIDDEVK